MLKSWFTWVVIIIILAGGFFIYKQATKPRGTATAPGETFADLGRNHITDITDVKHNSNPPTSGPHFPVWAKSGVYDRVISDGYLVHSLEHGYIVISYNCEKKVTGNTLQVTRVYAADQVASSEAKPLMKLVQPAAGTSWITPETQPTEEIKLPESFNSDSCKSEVKTLSDFSKSYSRMVVVPRPNMDHAIALTAWNHVLYMDKWNGDEAKKFADILENQGPEKTME